MVSYWEVPILLSVACWEGVEGGLGREGIPNGVQLTPTITSLASSHPFFTYLSHVYILEGKMRAAFYPHTMPGTCGIMHYENEIHQILGTEENLRMILFHSFIRINLRFGEVTCFLNFTLESVFVRKLRFFAARGW